MNAFVGLGWVFGFTQLKVQGLRQHEGSTPKVQGTGTPKCSGLKSAELLEKHKGIVRQSKAGQSVRNTAKITGKGASTVQRVKAAMKAAA
jgi:hypothetical protein